MKFKTIGYIESPFKSPEEAPKQGRETDALSVLVLEEAYQDGLYRLEEGDEIVVLYWGHLADRTRLLGRRRGQGALRGVFASRSPHRPNPIALNICQIVALDGNRVTVSGLDAIQGSPLLDIKIHIHSVYTSPEKDQLPPGIL